MMTRREEQAGQGRLADERQTKYVQGGWNLTGDACAMDDEGYVWFKARTDDLIISSGYNIGAPEVEAAVLQHAAVMECAVVGIPDIERGQAVKAYVVLRAGQSASEPLAFEPPIGIVPHHRARLAFLVSTFEACRRITGLFDTQIRMGMTT